jgi:hypothetical protein
LHIVVSDTYCVMYFVLFAFVLCVQCYQFLWIVQSWLFLQFSLTFIWNRKDMDTYYLSTMILIRSQCFIVLFKVYGIMYVFKPQMLLLSPPSYVIMWYHSFELIEIKSLRKTLLYYAYFQRANDIIVLSYYVIICYHFYLFCHVCWN